MINTFVMKKKEQIYHTELEKDSTESKKAALTDEKEDNLNQIRKQRTEKMLGLGL